MEKQHVSVDLKSGTPVWADLQSLSLHAKAASGIKRVIKESLVIQISHAYGVMSESRLRERSAEKPFQVEAAAEGEGRGGQAELAVVPLCFNSILYRLLLRGCALFK